MRPANAPALLTSLMLVATSSGAAPGRGFHEVDLASDLAGRATHQNSHIVNPWGIAPGHDRTFWVAANGQGLGLLLHADGATSPDVITIPPPDEGNPTGVLSEGTEDFIVSSGKKHARSRLIFASEDGSISAWNPALDKTQAIRVASTDGAVYKGLAIGHGKGGERLFAANFHSGRIDVFDEHFSPTTVRGGFRDAGIPDGYAPFNIASIGGKLYVTFAKQDEDAHDDVAGAGFGYVDLFDTNGKLVRRLVSQGALDAPWGLAFVHGHFGPFHHALLVGNFGDGRINAYAPDDGTPLGALSDGNGVPIAIEGLWGLEFASEGDDERGDRGEDSEEDEKQALFFTAGIDGESDGLFGKLEPLRSKRGDSDRPIAIARDAAAPASVTVDPTLRVALVGPNPARVSDAGGIRFRITGGYGSPARIGIYDLAGRLVAEPAKDVPIGDALEARWDGRNQRGGQAGAGVYFYRVQAAGQVVRGRVLLIP